MIDTDSASLTAPMRNGYLVASVAASALTIAVKTLAGDDPSDADPVAFNFRSVSAGDGTIDSVEATAALSLVVPSTATLGASNGALFKLWIAVFNNGGSLELAVINAPKNTWLDESRFLSTTAISTGADVADTLYSTSGLTSKPFRVIGYMEWTTGLATAGTWNAVPTVVYSSVAGVHVPNRKVRFRAHKNGSAQAIATTTVTKVTFGTEAWDVGDIFDTSNSRVTPPPGPFTIGVTAEFSSLTGIANIRLYKNGVYESAIDVRTADANSQAYLQGVVSILGNGTDYYEIFALTGTDSSYSIEGNTSFTSFWGEQV